MSYIKVTLDGVEHTLTPENLCLLRDQITKQADSLSIFESIKLANALQITGSQLIQFMTGLKKR
jgi:hypothetical protein